MCCRCGRVLQNLLSHANFDRSQAYFLEELVELLTKMLVNVSSPTVSSHLTKIHHASIIVSLTKAYATCTRNIQRTAYYNYHHTKIFQALVILYHIGVPIDGPCHIPCSC